jgi:glycosyltransferase involved in cell wall biosynthesis
MQTVRADEVVIVEDGPIGEQLTSSIDEFRDILPIRSLRLERNVGLGAALQCGLDSCHGEYIVRMDSDDICAPERFEKQLSFLNLHPEVDVLGGAIAEFDQDPAFPHSARVPPVCGASLLEFARHRNPLNHVTAMFRKASVLAVGGYQPFAGFEDYHLWARMLSKGFCLWNLQETLVYVRCGNGMQARRGGFQYAKRDVAFQLYLYNLGLVSGGELLRNVFIRVPFRLVPGSIRQSCYRVWLRERVVPDPS